MLDSKGEPNNQNQIFKIDFYQYIVLEFETHSSALQKIFLNV